ncbi:lysine-specific demethylase phf2-like isoform X2 [Choloepus didactylus]|uniref:lysine-specific demethylase phf2-like isoform X2 n=1 Tax=Choloepus didactylus TaxID=27675 RepID=UPI00189CF961|nr:lysine-specific demethylase phf2-like isoform X2 [Choloepus didactylus]
MCVKDGYTDFHIGSGGVSAWFHVLRDENEALAFGLVYMPQVLTNLGSSCCLIESKELKFSMELADHGLKNRKEQVSTLYENINLVELRLIQPHEHVITNCICEIKLQSPEIENLAIAVKRCREIAHRLHPRLWPK